MVCKEVLEGLAINEARFDPNMEITGIAYDSRMVKPGNLFVAITGYETDGHAYIGAAVQAGAAMVLCERAPEEDVPYALTENSREALADAAANFYRHPARELQMIGVTGTNGKTTITYLIKAILESRGEKVGLIGTNQNMIGNQVVPTERTTPESCDLQRLLRQMADAGCSHAIMEVSSHSLVLGRVHGIHFAVGVFTNVTQDHLDFHKTMEEYIRAKTLLFRQCKVGVVNIDDAASAAMMQGGSCDFITYGVKKSGADVSAKNIKLKPASVEFEALCFDSIGRIELHVPGEFSVYNGLGALAASLVLGATLTEAAKALAEVPGVKGRAEVVSTETDYTVMIDYAHSPDGLTNILKTVRGFAAGRVIAVFGCGGDRDRKKRPIMGGVASRLADFLVITSDNPRTEDPMEIIREILPGVTKKKEEYHVEPDRRQAIYYALDHARAGDVVVLAGKGHETYQEINHVKNHMDEREIVEDYFQEKKSGVK